MGPYEWHRVTPNVPGYVFTAAEGTAWILLGEFKTTGHRSDVDRPYGWTNDPNYNRCVPTDKQWVQNSSETVKRILYHGAEYIWKLAKWNPSTNHLTTLDWLEIDVEPTNQEKTIRTVKVQHPSSRRSPKEGREDQERVSPWDITCCGNIITERYLFVPPMDRNPDGTLSQHYCDVSIGKGPGTCRPGRAVPSPYLNEITVHPALRGTWKIPVFTPLEAQDVQVVINPADVTGTCISAASEGFKNLCQTLFGTSKRGERVAQRAQAAAAAGDTNTLMRMFEAAFDAL